MTRTHFILLTALLHGAALTPVRAADFRLQEWLGREWRQECVTFPLTADQVTEVKAGGRLVDPDGKAVASQLVPGKEPRLAFLADLDPFETRVYRLAGRDNPTPTDLKVEETEGEIRLSNLRTGVLLDKTAVGGSGPLMGFRLASGPWVGGSRLLGDQPPAKYEAAVTARGPVFAEVTCTTTWVDGSTWQIKFRLDAGAPVVTVEEDSKCAVPGAAFGLYLDRGWAPDRLFCRQGKGNLNKLLADPIAPGEVFVLEPWLHWWERPHQGPWMACYNAQGPDMLELAAYAADLWVDPAIPTDQRQPSRVTLIKDEGGLHANFPLRTGRRKWLLATLDRDAVMKDVNFELPTEPPLPQRVLIKQGLFPLDMVKDYTLQFQAAADFPHVMLTAAQAKELRQRVGDPAPAREALPGYLQQEWLPYNLLPQLSAYLVTEDAELGRRIVSEATKWMQATVDNFTKPGYMFFNQGPGHAGSAMHAVHLADFALSVRECPPETRDRLLAQAAFLGYTLVRTDFWDPERGFCANPNMTTSVAGAQAAVGCLLTSHPLGRKWAEQGLTELKSELENWSDEGGGWWEAPHYAMVSYDPILGGFLKARNAGVADYLYLPRMKKVMEWFAKISTPPDARLNGFRHLPPLGNTYLFEPTGEFGLAAYLWKDQDPEFSAHMQWMWQQQWSYGQPGIGGAYAALDGYRELLSDPNLPAKAPAYGSEWFPRTGVVLRNAYPSDRETYLHLIAGSNHQHYDFDSGSIVVWGKGRIIAADFGYYGRAPVDDHNMLETPVGTGGEGMQVQEFTPGPQLDYVNALANGWRRQIAFVKDADPMAPNYFVVGDSLAIPSPGTWRLWCTASEVQPEPGRALVVGKEDVDTDVIFADPPGLAVTTEAKTRRSASGMSPDKRWGPMESTQLGIIAQQDKGRRYLVVIYPRLKNEPSPTVTPIADGKGVKVETPAGTDWVFLSAEPFTYQEGDLSFSGTAGMVQQRGGNTFLALGSGGRLTAGGQTVTSDKTPPLVEANLVPQGDFERGGEDLFIENARRPLTAIFEGNPAGPASKHEGQRCLALDARSPDCTVFGLAKPVFVDAEKTYRINLKVFVPTAKTVDMAGYGFGEKGPNVNLADAQGQHWQWGLFCKGPMSDWQALETTIGPPGSGAAQTWPPGILSTGLGMWIRGESGMVYLDDVRWEEFG